MLLSFQTHQFDHDSTFVMQIIHGIHERGEKKNLLYLCSNLDKLHKCHLSQK